MSKKTQTETQPKEVHMADCRLIRGDCLHEMAQFPDAFFDAMITDPPAGIGFMNQKWDKDKGGRNAWIAWMQTIMEEALRILKPGAHVFVWALPKKSHWTAMALENAGFEIRDIQHHIFASGFPKNHSLGMPEGLKSALRPACEHWILARAPIAERTVAINIRVHGVGALRVLDCAVEHDEKGRELKAQQTFSSKHAQAGRRNTLAELKPEGRWPQHLAFSHMPTCDLDNNICDPRCPAHLLSLQHQANTVGSNDLPISRTYPNFAHEPPFYFCPKPSGKEKTTGINGSAKKCNDGRHTAIDNPYQRGETERTNTHPTIKPIKLMRWLIRLITPPNGLILDPFMGSGTTGVAAIEEGVSFCGIEQESEFFKIAVDRISHATTQPFERLGSVVREEKQIALFEEIKTK